VEQTILTIHSINNVIQKRCTYTLPTHKQRYLSAPDLGHRHLILYKWLRSLKPLDLSLQLTLPRILATLAHFSNIFHLKLSDATGSANVPLSTHVTPTASVAPTAGTSDSDAQTPVTFIKRMQKDLANKISSVDEDRGNTNRKLAELLTSVALDSASKLTSHYKRLTRLVEENNDDLIAEVSSFMDDRVPANAATAPAPAAAAAVLLFVSPHQTRLG